MNGFIYVLRLLEPVLANSMSGDPNAARTLPFVPGALIRGAAIQAYQKQPQRRAFDAAEPEAQRLFFNGKTRYLHAYPVIYDGGRGLPAPLAWRKRKKLGASETEEAREIFDWAEERLDEQLNAMSEDAFCIVKGQEVYWREPEYQINVHTQRDAIKGKAVEGLGAIYRYEALPVGLRLKGVVLTELKDDADYIKKLLVNHTILLGKSRTAGYGKVILEEIEDLPYGWREVGEESSAYEQNQPESESDYDMDEADLQSDDAAQESQAFGGPAESLEMFKLTLLSEAIVRDESGQFTLDPLPAIRRRMNALLKELEEDAEIEKRQFRLEHPEERDDQCFIFRKYEIVGGFNRKWRLPLTQASAIPAGSVFFIRAAPPVPRTILRRLEEDGIGERQAEGFGRVAINWPSETPHRWIADRADEESDSAAAIKLTEEEKELGRLMLRRMLLQKLDNLLLEAVHDLKIVGNIPNSQLSRWRAVTRSAMAEKSPVRRVGRLVEFLAAEEEKKSNAWEKMRRARVHYSEGTKRLTDWVKNVLTDENSPWRWFPELGNRVPESLKLGREVEVKAEKEVAVEYRLRLIDGVLARKAKEQAADKARSRQ
jgi:CRISPR-associated protein Csx10